LFCTKNDKSVLAFDNLFFNSIGPKRLESNFKFRL
jgi:hypothetical protein